MRLMSTASFQAARTTGLAVPRPIACSWLTRSGSSFGECSVSSRIQSKPECAMISAPRLLHSVLHRPICSSRRASVHLNSLRVICTDYLEHSCVEPGSNELHRHRAERTEIAVHRVTLVRPHDP